MVHRPTFFPASDDGRKTADAIAYPQAMTGDVDVLRQLDSPPKTTELAKAATGFVANMSRVIRPLGLPGFLAQWAREVQYFEMLGNFNVLNTPIWPDDIEVASAQACSDEALKLYIESRRTSSIRAELSATYAWTHMTINSFVSSNPLAPKCLIDILSGAAANLWTAFEIFSGDLWESALNCHPQELSQLKGRRKGGESLQMDHNHIHRYAYNLSQVMGTLIKSRYKFSNVASIKIAYKEAFWRDFGDLDAIIPSSMDALECTRNLLVHRAGIVDEQFIRRTRKHGVYSNLTVGEQIPIDGPLIAEFLQATINSAGALFQAVDDWIAAH